MNILQVKQLKNLDINELDQLSDNISLQEQDISLSNKFQLNKVQLVKKLKQNFWKKIQSPLETSKELLFLTPTTPSIIQDIQEDIQKSQITASVLDINAINKDISDKLSRFLKNSKRYISKLWVRQICKFINLENTREFQISQIKIQKIKKYATKYSISFKQFANILKDNQWIRIILKEKGLINDQLLQQIFQSKKIKDHEKILLIQTYEIFKDAVINPQEFKSWRQDKRKKKLQSQAFYNKYKNDSLKKIIQLFEEQFKADLKKLQNKKCSKLNNISYCWVLYLKNIFEQGEFQKKIKNDLQLNQNLKQLLIKSPSISSIKNVLRNRTFADYILQQKITTRIIIKEIITNQKLHVLNKKNMLESLICFQQMIINCDNVAGWIKNALI